MQVKYLRLWRGCREGSVKDLADGVANYLISRGICEPFADSAEGQKSPKGNSSGGRKRRNRK